MTSSMAFRRVQAWPAAWAGKDTPRLAAALMAQRPPMRPRKDALLEVERLHHRRLIDHLCEELFGETMRREEREHDNRFFRWGYRFNELFDKERERATLAKERVGELEHSTGGWSAASRSHACTRRKAGHFS